VNKVTMSYQVEWGGRVRGVVGAGGYWVGAGFCYSEVVIGGWATNGASGCNKIGGLLTITSS
jgi:hypothetical protein